MSGGSLSSCICSHGLVPLAPLVTPSNTRFSFFTKKLQLPQNATEANPRFLSLAHRSCIKALACRVKSESSPSRRSTRVTERVLTIAFLMTSCGLSLEAALSASRSVSRRNREKAGAIIQLLRDYTFSDDQINKIATSASKVLTFDPAKVKSRLDFLLSEGFSMKEVADTFGANYRLFQRHLDRGLIATYRFLSATLPSRSEVMAALKRRHQYLTADAEPRLKLLRDNGVPEPVLWRLVTLRPDALTHTLERLEETVKTLLELGLDPKIKSFVYPLGYVASISRETLLKKIKFHKELGISESHSIDTLLKGHPDIFSWDDERLRHRLDFFKKNFGWEPADVLKYPINLKVSIEGRILPRVPVLKVLMSKGLIQNRWLGYYFAISDKRFIEGFVTRYLDEVPDIVKIFEDSKAD